MITKTMRTIFPIIAIVTIASVISCSAPSNNSNNGSNNQGSGGNTSRQGQGGNSGVNQRGGNGTQQGQGNNSGGSGNQFGQGGNFGGNQRGGGATITVQAVKVGISTLDASETTSGSIIPVNQSQVAALTSGVVARILHQAGDWVKEGDVIVELDDSQTRIAYLNASSTFSNAQINLSMAEDNTNQANPKLVLQLDAVQSSLSAAQKNYDTVKAQYDLGGATDAQLDNATSQLAQAKANLEGAKTALDQNKNAGTQNLAQLRLSVEQAGNQVKLAEINLANTKIKAPFSGQIAAINLSKGMFLSQNTSAFTLVSTERQVAFSIPPTSADSFFIGRSVSFYYNGKTYPIRIKQTPSAPINGVVPITASLPAGFAPPFGVVGTVSYSIALAKGAIIPFSALQTLEDKNYVFAIEDNKIVIKYIVILDETGVSAAAAGLDSGALVVINPPPGLIPGASVQPIIIDQNTGAAADQGTPEPQSGNGSKNSRSTPAPGSTTIKGTPEPDIQKFGDGTPPPGLGRSRNGTPPPGGYQRGQGTPNPDFQNRG
jgi:HlyD family secretion protein